MLKFNLHLEGDEKDLEKVIAGLDAAFGNGLVVKQTGQIDTIFNIPAIEKEYEQVKEIIKNVEKPKAEKKVKTETPAPAAEEKPESEPVETTTEEAAEALAAPAGVTFETVQKMFAELKTKLAEKHTDLQLVNDKLKALREKAAPGSKALTDMRKDEFKQYIPAAFLLLQKELKANGDA